MTAAAHAQLVGGKVTAGSASITETAASALIQQTTQRAIITWSGFSIPKGYSVTVQQPGASSVLLNRVTGGTPSYLLGSLTANGQVWIVNPAGIITGRGAQITAAGLLLSTSGISDANFLSGSAVFDEPGNPGAKVWNGGTITVSDGYAVLAGAQVANDGVIEARLGSVVLAGAKTYTVDFSGDGLLSFAIGAASGANGTLVRNAGKIAADGGAVLLTAASAKSVLDNVINTSGLVEADSVATQNGKIVLLASGGGTAVSGTLDASGKSAGETGGEVEVLGNSVTLASTAKVDVSGASGGGTALVGGNFHGSGPEPDAASTTVAAGATIDADALDDGNGGNVAVWSNGTTTVAGAITARGGAAGGNGGYVETSGASLDIAGITVDTSAAAGAAGTWLLDPADFSICDAGCTMSPGSIVAALATSDMVIEATDDNSANGAALGPATGNITVSDPILYSSANDLSLLAQGNITVSASITNSGAGDLNLIAGWDGATGLAETNFSVAALAATPASYGNGGSTVTLDGGIVSSAGGATTFAGASAAAIEGVITNTAGTFAVDIDSSGALCDAACPDGNASPGFERTEDGFDPLAVGVPRDSWGIAWSGAASGSAQGDPSTMVFGGDENEVSLASFSAHGATVVNSIGGGVLTLTQSFGFAAPNVLAIGETIVNTGGGSLAVEFQRDVAWHFAAVPSQITTIPAVSPAPIVDASYYGFENPDPVVPYGASGYPAGGTKGPSDLGAGIKIALDNLAPGASDSFDYLYALGTAGQSGAALETELVGIGASYSVLTTGPGASAADAAALAFAPSLTLAPDAAPPDPPSAPATLPAMRPMMPWGNMLMAVETSAALPETAAPAADLEDLDASAVMYGLLIGTDGLPQPDPADAPRPSQ